MKRQHSDRGHKVFDIIRITSIGLSIIVLLVGGFFILSDSPSRWFDETFGGGQIPEIDFETLVLPVRSDEYLICPQDLCLDTDPDEFSPEFDIPPEKLRAILLEYADLQVNVRRLRLDLAKQQYDFADQSPTMRFPDIITVRIIDLGAGRSTIAIYSRSVSSFAKKGSNAKRARRWLTMISPNR